MTDLDKRLRVVLLTRAGCSRCDRAHDLLTRLASDYPLAITGLDVDGPDGAALATRMGVLFTPAVVIGADAVVSGRITEQRLRKAIEGRLLSGVGVETPTPHSGWLRHGRSFLGWLARSW